MLRVRVRIIVIAPLVVVVLFEYDLSQDSFIEEIDYEPTHRKTEMVGFEHLHDFVEQRRFLESRGLLGFDTVGQSAS